MSVADGGFSVQPPVLDATGRKLAQAGSDIEGVRGELSKQADLSGALGFPQATSAYSSMYQAWSADIGGLAQLVNGLGGKTVIAGDNYSTTDDVNGGLFGG